MWKNKRLFGKVQWALWEQMGDKVVLWAFL